MKRNVQEAHLHYFLIKHIGGENPHTISSYLSSVKAFFRWFQDQFQKVTQQLFMENISFFFKKIPFTNVHSKMKYLFLVVC
jgi:hypothetical protein